MSAERYFDAVEQALRVSLRTQQDTIAEAARVMVDAVARGSGLFAFGASHSFILAEELVYRTGGLMLVNPIYPHGMNLSVRPMTLTSRLERVPGLGAELLRGSRAQTGDVLILVSTSGRNAVVIDMAQEAREQGITLIGVTSAAYTSGVTSRHASGRKMADLCDIVLDNGAPYGDAAVAIEGFPQKVGPLSTVLGCALLNALVTEVVQAMVQRGIEPPVFMSANVDGGDEYNARLLSANADRIHYM